MKTKRQYTNLATWQPRTVTLHDGRQVLCTSQEWRLECEARDVLSWPLGKRRDYLFGPVGLDGQRKGGVEKYRGKAGLQMLLDKIDELHRAERAKKGI